MAVKRPRYTFLKDESTPQCKYSLMLTGASFGCLAVLLAIATAQSGLTDAALGAAGLAGLLVAWYSFSVSLRELVKRPPVMRLAVISTILSGVLSIIWLALFLAGVKQG